MREKGEKLMKKWIALLLCAALLLAASACTKQLNPSSLGASSLQSEGGSSEIPDDDDLTPDTGGTLVLYTWISVFPQTVLDEFTAETGIAVDYQTFDRESVMLSQIDANRPYDYDLIVANDSTVEGIIQKGLAQKLDRSKLANWENINPLYQGLSLDPQDEYTVPYGAAVQSIVYSPASVGEITGYADLWNAILKDKLGLVPDAQVVVGMALKAVEESYGTTDKASIEKAGEKLMELVPNVKAISDMELPQKLASGEIGAAVMYPTQALSAVVANEELKLVFPKEGTGFGVQEAFIPANAPNPDAAHAFLDFILRPEIAARCFEYLGFASTNRSADSLLSAFYQPLLSLPKNYIELEHLTPSAAQADLDAVWKEFRAACEK